MEPLPQGQAGTEARDLSQEELCQGGPIRRKIKTTDVEFSRMEACQ